MKLPGRYTLLRRYLSHALLVGAALLGAHCSSSSPSSTPSVPGPDASTTAGSSGSSGASGSGGGGTSGGSGDAMTDQTAPVFAGATMATALGESQVNVVWLAAMDDLTPTERIAYRLYVGRGTAPDLSKPFLTTPAGATGATATGLQAASDYQFTVRAVDEAGNEDQNVVVVTASTTDTTRPVFSGVTSVTSTTPTSLHVTWDAATDNAPGDVTYQIFVSTVQGGEDFTTPTLVSDPGATSIDITGLTDLTNYFVVVRAVDASGNADKNKKELTTATLDGTAPVFAGATSATALGTAITVAWDPAIDHGDPTTSPYIFFNVYMSTTAGGEDFTTPSFKTAIGASNQTALNLLVSTHYYFVVRAVDSSLNEDKNTVEVSAITAASPDVKAPTFAGLATMTPLSATSISLTWLAATDDYSDPSAIVYDIYVASATGAEVLTAPTYTTPPGQTSFLLTNLSPKQKQFAIVRARDQVGNEDKNTVEKSATTLADTTAPTFAGLTSALATGPQTIALTWSAATDDASASSNIFYTVYSSTSAGSESFTTPVATTQKGATQIVIGTLLPSTKYYFVVRATDEYGNRDGNTIEKSDTTKPDVTAPQFGGALSAVAQSPTSILVSWNPASDDVAAASAIQYDVYVATASGAETFATPSAATASGATSYLVTGLAQNTPYFFVVRARDPYGNEDNNQVEATASTLADTTAPTFAGATSVNTATNTSLRVNWAAALDDVTPVSGIKYRICYSTTAGSCITTFTVAATVTNLVSYTASGLLPNTAYYFVVRAEDAVGNRDTNTVERSGATTADVTAPTFGGLTTATALSPTSISLTWSAGSDNVTTPANLVYDIYRASAAGAEVYTTATATTSAGATSFVVSGLTPNTPYYFVVRARDQAGNRDANVAEKTATTKPDTTAPTFGGATGVAVVSETALTVSWSAASDDTNPASSIVYQVCWSLTATGCTTTFTAMATTAPAALNYTATGLKPATKYFFVVRAKDTYGNVDGNTNVASNTTLADTAPPTFGGAQSISGAGDVTLTVNWNNATDNVTVAANMTYQVCITQVSGGCSGASFSVSKTVVGGNSSQFTGLTPVTTYYFVVRAQDEAGNNDGNSTQISGSTVSDVVAPTFAGLTSATATSATSINLVWTAATDNVSTPAQIVYDVYQATAAGGEVFASPSYTTAGGATSLSVTGLIPNKSYFFVVRARDQAGNRDANAVERTAKTLADTTAPVFAGLVTVDTATASKQTLHWAAATDDSTAQAALLYDICWSTVNGGCQNAGFSAMQTSAAGASSAIVSGLTPNQLYFFVVRARDAFGNEDTNNVQKSGSTTLDTTAPIFAGATVVNTATVTTLRVNWAAATDDASLPANIVYDVCWSTAGTCAATFNTMATTAGGALNYTATGLNPNTTYYFVVRARDEAGNRDTNTVQPSGATLVDSTAPTFAGATLVDNPTLTSLRVNWALATDNATPQANIDYLVCWSTSPTACTSSFTVLATVTNLTNYTANGLTPNTTYYFVVRSRDLSLNVDTNAVVRSGTALADVTAPTGGVVSAISNQTYTSLRVNFTQATDNFTPQGSIVYRICRRTGAQAATTCTTSFDVNYQYVVVGSPLFVDELGLAMGTNYFFVVRAVDQAGNESTNTTEIAGATVTDVTPPTWSDPYDGQQDITVTTVLTTGAGNVPLSASWAAASDDFYGSGNIRYRLCWNTDWTQCWGGTWTVMGTTGLGVTSFQIPGTSLLSHTYYYVMVRAEDASGNREVGNHWGYNTTAYSFQNDVNAPVFGAVCSACHGWNYANTVGVTNAGGYVAGTCGGTTLQYIKTSDPLHSYIYRKISSVPIGSSAAPFTGACLQGYNGGRMPCAGAFLADATIQNVYNWIAQGAQNN